MLRTPGHRKPRLGVNSMCRHRMWCISDPHRPTLERDGLDRFETLMHGDIGVVIHKDTHSELRRIESTGAGGETRCIGFLKRSLDMPLRHLLRMAIHRHMPHVEAVREAITCRHLHARGFHVAPVMTHGEERCCGRPLRGFMLSERIDGSELTDLWSDANEPMQDRILDSMGHLIGRLHAAGFFQLVRPRDLICTAIPDDDESNLELTLLDRASLFPSPRRCSPRLCFKHLRYTAHRYRKNNILYSPHEIAVLARAYCHGLESALHLKPERVRDALGECTIHS